MRKTAILAAAIGGLIAFSTAAQARPARCEITDGTDASAGRYSGPCDFTARKGGSFEIVLPDAASDKVLSSYIVVTVTKPGIARLSGSVWGRGQVNDWGIVRREAKRPACWSGEWGKVCVF